ncbi:MAG: magnesium chelatase domain-containing protein, partial [bacterium]|nr:magnesium chelatase domain-containing protein [bacterium]
GGIRISDPAADLGIAVCLASSFRNLKLPREMVVVGEVGLTGEVRGVSRIEARIAEAGKIGFKKMILPKNNFKEVRRVTNGLQLYFVSSVQEALQLLWNM